MPSQENLKYAISLPVFTVMSHNMSFFRLAEYDALNRLHGQTWSAGLLQRLHSGIYSPCTADHFNFRLPWAVAQTFWVPAGKVNTAKFETPVKFAQPLIVIQRSLNVVLHKCFLQHCKSALRAAVDRRGNCDSQLHRLCRKCFTYVLLRWVYLAI